MKKKIATRPLSGFDELDAAGIGAGYRGMAFEQEPEPEAKIEPKGRTWGEAATDLGAGALQGALGVARLGARIGDAFTHRQGDENPAIKFLNEYGDAVDMQKSEKLREEEQKSQQAVAAAGQRATERFGDGVGGKVARFGAEFGTGAYEAVSNPTLLANSLAEQIPMMGTMKAGQKAAELLVKGATSIAPRAMATSVGQRIAGNAGLGGAVATGMALQGSDVKGETYKRMMELPLEMWRQNPEFVALSKSIGEDAAKIEIAGRESSTAGLQSAGTSLATSFLPGGTAMERALVGGKKIPIAAVPQAIAGEFAQEGTEEGTGRLAGNNAVSKINTKQDMLDGVGGAAGQGGAVGGILGGGSTLARVGLQNYGNKQTPVDPAIAAAQALADQQAATRKAAVVAAHAAAATPNSPIARATAAANPLTPEEAWAKAQELDAQAALDEANGVEQVGPPAAPPAQQDGAMDALVAHQNADPTIQESLQVQPAPAFDAQAAQEQYRADTLAAQKAQDDELNAQAEAALATIDQRKQQTRPVNEVVSDGGYLYEGTQDGDVLNGLGKPFTIKMGALQEAKRQARDNGGDWTAAPVFDGYVARKVTPVKRGAEFDVTHAGSAAIADPKNADVVNAYNRTQFATAPDGSAMRVGRDHFESWANSGGVTSDVGSQYDGHGIAKGNPLGALLNILENGINTSRRFDSAPLTPKSSAAGAGSGLGSANGAYKDGPFILLGERGKSITEGIKTVLVSDEVAATIPALQDRFPGIRFVSHSDAQSVLSKDRAQSNTPSAPEVTAQAATENVAPGDVERYQWQRNAEGGQERGNQQTIQPLTEALFNEYIAPKVAVKSYRDYQQQFPAATHISLVQKADGGMELGAGGVGPIDKLRPSAAPVEKGWVKAVDSFDSPEAVAHGGTADSASQPKSLAGEPIDKDWTAFHPESGTLDVPRADMPQIEAGHRGAMVNFLKARGISSTQEEVPTESLKPTQAEYSPEKVGKAKGFKGNDRSILVSSDGHVLDGHHQWVAKHEAGQPVKVIRLDAPIDALLSAVREFPSAETTVNSTTQEQTAENKSASDAERKLVKVYESLMALKSTELKLDDGRGRKLYAVKLTPEFKNKHFVHGRMPSADGLEMKSTADITGDPYDKGYTLIDNREQLAARRKQVSQPQESPSAQTAEAQQTEPQQQEGARADAEHATESGEPAADPAGASPSEVDLKTVEGVARAVQLKVAANRRKFREKSRKEREAKGYAPNSTPESEQADYEAEISAQPSDMQKKSAAAMLGTDPIPLIGMFVNGNFEASEDVFKAITGVKIRGLSAAAKKAALYQWAKWTPEQIAQAEGDAQARKDEAAEKNRQDDLKSAVMGAWLGLDRLKVNLKSGDTITGQDFVLQSVAGGFDKAHSQKKGAAVIYGLTDGGRFTTLKNPAFTAFVKAAIAFGGLDTALTYVNPPKPQAPEGFVDRSIDTADSKPQREVEESAQEKGEREYGENYNRVANTDDLSTLQTKDIERAFNWASREAGHEKRKGWDGGEVNQNLVAALDSEIARLDAELKSRRLAAETPNPNTPTSEVGAQGAEPAPRPKNWENNYGAASKIAEGLNIALRGANGKMKKVPELVAEIKAADAGGKPSPDGDGQHDELDSEMRAYEERATRIESTLANGGHVVGDQLRSNNGMGLMKLTPAELTRIPENKVREKPDPEKARVDTVKNQPKIDTSAEPVQKPAESGQVYAPQIEWTRTRNVDRMGIALKAGFKESVAESLSKRSWSSLDVVVQEKLAEAMAEPQEKPSEPPPAPTGEDALYTRTAKLTQPYTLDDFIGNVDAGYRAHFDYAGADGRTLWIERVEGGWVLKSKDDDSTMTITKAGAGAGGRWSKAQALREAENDAKYRYTEWKPVAGVMFQSSGEKAAITAGFKYLTNDHTWVKTVAAGEKRSELFNIREFGPENDRSYRVTKATSFPGTGATGSPSVDLGTFKTLDVAVEAAEKAQTTPTNKAGATSSSPAIQDFLDGKRDDAPTIEEVKAEASPLVQAMNFLMELQAKQDANGRFEDDRLAQMIRQQKAVVKELEDAANKPADTPSQEPSNTVKSPAIEAEPIDAEDRAVLDAAKAKIEELDSKIERHEALLDCLK